MKPMTENQRAYFLNLFDAGETNSLGALSPIYSSIVEVTLNYPRTAAFKRMSQQEQKNLYETLFVCIQKRLMDLKDSQFTFEECKDGTVHLHGYLYIESKSYGCIEGLIQEVVKGYLAQMPLRYNKYSSQLYYPHFCRYRSPMICAQYREGSDSARLDTWKEYITKSQI